MTNPLPARALSGTDVNPPPGLYPARIPLQGRYARLEPIDPRQHAEELWDATHTGPEDDRLWDYLGYGPFTDRAVFKSWLRDDAALADPNLLRHS